MTDLIRRVLVIRPTICTPTKRHVGIMIVVVVSFLPNPKWIGERSPLDIPLSTSVTTRVITVVYIPSPVENKLMGKTLFVGLHQNPSSGGVKLPTSSPPRLDWGGCTSSPGTDWAGWSLKVRTQCTNGFTPVRRVQFCTLRSRCTDTFNYLYSTIEGRR